MQELKDQLIKRKCCSICLAPLKDDFAVTVCGHLFHYECIKKSLETKAECPECRKPLDKHTGFHRVFSLYENLTDAEIAKLDE
jgi:hypothetical protein